MDFFDISSVVDWSRLQFAMTAGYHWIFVPLTLGLAVIMSIMETIYVRTGKEEWKDAAKFWMTIFGINFAVGVATGLILEFQFGTNWSNYSWFVGDIFGAPLAIEAIIAFFLEATFISVMFFGWNKVSKKAHLTATWLVTLGATLSALWILIANAWMQYPIGMEFNPETVRNEMVDFWAIALSPVAINKFFHTTLSGWATGAAFVAAISSWYLIKKRNQDFALKSLKIAIIFGLVSFTLLAVTGDGSGYEVAQKQPMKLAAMEGLYEGKEGAGLVAIGVLHPSRSDKSTYADDIEAFHFKIELPKLLSLMGHRKLNAFVPGVRDIVEGGYTLSDGTTALSFEEKRERGAKAIEALANYQSAMDEGRTEELSGFEADLQENFAYFGYGYLDSPEQLIPNVPLIFYSFRVMVVTGFYYILLFAIMLYFYRRRTLTANKWILYVALWSLPLAYLAGQAGWIVAEVGRQPWAIQDILPVQAAVSSLETGSVVTTFLMFVALFTALLIAEISIMVKQIKKGPAETKDDSTAY